MKHRDKDAEKGRELHEEHSNVYGDQAVIAEASVAQAVGRGGETHRGLKSRHIQFLYVFSNQLVLQYGAHFATGPWEERLELDCLLAQEPFSLSSDRLRSSWRISR